MNHCQSIEYLKECLRYESGKLFWMERPANHFKNIHSMNRCNTRFAGREAGCLSSDKSGRWLVVISGKMSLRSHIVWAICNGTWPSKLIDHKNRIPTDDRVENLREATYTQNNCNRSVMPGIPSGLKGVYWKKSSGKWSAQIKILGKNTYLGLFATKEEAHDAYVMAAKVNHGEFACVG